MTVPDSEAAGWLGALPRAWRPYALLARFDRPVGWQLLYWPCAWGLALAVPHGGDWWFFVTLALGAVVMRGAGCVLNDLADRKLDALVVRTRDRPLASGAVSVRAALVWLMVLLAIGCGVWLTLPIAAKLVALATLPVVAIYPYMKRITWWPQAFLGLVFASGALVGYAAVSAAPFRPGGGAALAAMAWLYAGGVLWVIGYDTIYALQDREDDALIGIRSSARRLGTRMRTGVALFYAGAAACWGLSLWQVRPDPLALLALLPATLHLAWQTATLRVDDGAGALTLFRANRRVGLLVGLACLVVGMASGPF